MPRICIILFSVIIEGDNRTMKIAFTGTHVTGKTTLLNDYRDFIASTHANRSVGAITGMNCTWNYIARISLE